MKLSALGLSTLLLTLLSTPLNAATQEEQLAREHARAAAIAAAKSQGKAATVTMEEPTRSYFDWGAVVHPNGEVLSVRNASVAAEMGLTAGDRLLQVDDIDFSEAGLDTIVSHLQGLEHDSTINVTVARDTQTLTLGGRVKATVIPGWRLEVDVAQAQVDKTDDGSCGRVSVFVTPPEARDLFPAYFVKIDDDNVLRRRSIYKLDPGVHVIELHELITDPWVRRSSSMSNAKQLEIDVKADTTYYIAAKFNRNKRLSTVREEYWEPVVWREVEQKCEGD